MIAPHGQSGIQWRKSSRSGGNGQCVEVAALGGLIGLRDSKAPEAGHLPLSRQAFAELADRVKRGQLEL